MEEDTGIEYTYDPVMQDWKKKVAPYSAIVCKDGSTVWAEDSDGKTIASGEAGVDDASVIQSAIDHATADIPSDSFIRPTIVLSSSADNNKMYIKSTIYIRKPLQLVDNGVELINESDGFLLEVDNGDTDTYPQNVKLCNLCINANGRKGAALRYCGNPKMYDCVIYNAKVALEFERVWGGNSLVFNCIFMGEADDENGLIRFAYPSRAPDNTNAVRFIDCSSYQTNPNASDIFVDRQNTGNVNLIYIWAWESESKGMWLYAPYHIDALFIDEPRISTWRHGLYIVGGKILHISGGEMAKMYLENVSQAVIDGCSPAIKPDDPISDKPWLYGYGGPWSVKNIHFASISNDAPLIHLGMHDDGTENHWYATCRIESCAFLSCDVPIAIRMDPNGSQRAIISCQFRKLNPENTRTGVVAISVSNYYDKLIVRNCQFADTDYYDIGNITEWDFDGIMVEKAPFKNSGTQTFDGDGTTTDFLIGDHGLAVTDPSRIVVKVTPVSSDAIAASPCVGYVDPADNTKIRVKFASAPASGTGNVKIVWEAQVIS
ncbi:MAG: hypothetical protein J7J01_02625 [Methanophagales archaeon]|nr:hypothetical protein [Methanophagales archaeon]